MSDETLGVADEYCDRCKADHPTGIHWKPFGTVQRPQEARGSWPRCASRFDETPGPYWLCIFAARHQGHHCARQPVPNTMGTTLLWWA